MATILVVEDERAIRELISAILRSAGHQIITASNGMEGIALFRSSPERFDLILTDLEMPVMNGHQLIKLARETNAGAKIICMSGYLRSDFGPWRREDSFRSMRPGLEISGNRPCTI
jgi:CheY-like chemotaxis protein